DTRPGRALKAYLPLAPAARGPLALALPLAPYGLRPRGKLGAAGAETRGALLGFGSVSRLGARSRWSLIAGLALLTFAGERRSLGSLIEGTPVLQEIDA